jgi:NTE family protein
MTLDERVAHLMAVEEFRDMPAQARAALAAAMREEVFARGETVTAAGEPADRVFILCEGALEVARAGTGGLGRRLTRGALLGELAFFAGEVRTATVRAASDSVALSLPYEKFRAFLISYPESALILAGRIAATLRGVEAELAEALHGGRRS